MIVIPLQTVIPEELAFRGVLHGTLDRAWGFRGVAAAGSLLFGASLNRANPARMFGALFTYLCGIVLAAGLLVT